MISNGIDLGDRSLAVAAVELDDEQIPQRLRALSLLLHDGGVIDEQYKVSRIAKRGLARRTRKRYQRTRRRPVDVRKALLEAGFPAPEATHLPPTPDPESKSLIERGGLGTRVHDAQFPHFARRALLTPIDDNDVARMLFSIAVLHIDRHRGWRNPWQSIDSMLRAIRTDEGDLQFTSAANRWLTAVGSRFGQQVRTYGEAGAVAINHGKAVRPNNRALAALGTDISKAHAATKRARGPEDLATLVSNFVVPVRPAQHDLAVELLLLAEIQGFDIESVEKLVRTVFWQEKPGFSKDVIGKCPLVEGQRRAAAYLPAVQEWKIRGFVANLRLRVDNEDARRLTGSETERLVTGLRSVKFRSDVRWGTLEDWLSEITSGRLKLNRNNRAGERASGSEDEDESSIETSRHPVIDGTNSLVLRDGSKWKSFKTWWVAADEASRIKLLGSLDPANSTESAELFRDTLIEDGTIDAEEFEEFMTKLPDGRVAYSATAIEKMLPLMRDGADLYEARQEAFGLEPDWSPPGIEWDAPRMNHPVLQVVRSGLNKSLTAIDTEVGVADFVRVEAARRSMSIKYEKRKFGGLAKENEARNVMARGVVEELGHKPSRGRVRAARIIADQGCKCAYGIACAGNVTLSPSNSELDHIIPRVEGSGNPRMNLVAVCRECNRKKGGRAFAAVATEEQVEAAVEQMKTWQLENFSPDLPKNLERHLRAKSADEVDMRSPTPTAQVSTQMCNMLESRYRPLGGETKCEPVNAGVAAEARRSAGFKKSRTDHRHHVVDAIIVASINNRVIPFLRERQAMRDYAYTFFSSEEHDARMAAADAYGLNTDYFNRWLAGLRTVINEITELLARNGEPPMRNGDGPADPIADLDVVAPRRPIRLKAAARNGEGVLIAADPLHEQTAVALEQKPLGDSWSKDEIFRIGDRDLHVSLRKALRESKKGLPVDPNRVLVGERGELAADDLAALTPRVPQVIVRGAAYAIGSVHHLRVYEFDDGSGPKRAFLPVYRFDVVQALREETDSAADRRSTHVQLHAGAVSYRSAATKRVTSLIEAIDSGEKVVQVGWIAPGDEIFLDDSKIIAEGKKGSAPPIWLNERRHYCSGFDASIGYLTVKPLVAASPEDVSTSSVKLRISLANSMTKVTVIRRDSLGRIKHAWRPER